MFIKLPFKYLYIPFNRDVNIVLNIGCLEDVCNDLSIEYHELPEYTKKHPKEFTTLLMYYGYLAGCIESRKKPRYTKCHAERWANGITVEESAKLLILMGDLYGKLDKAATESKKKS